MSFNLREIFKALADANVEYVVVGGMAVILHGHLRATRDLDLVIGLQPDNCLTALKALGGIGLAPRLPVALVDFADPAKREDWIQNRNMLVFQVWHPADPFCTVDVFIRNPIDFEGLWQRSITASLGRTDCRIAGIEDLIAMKTQAGRPQDLRDIDQLRRIQQLQGAHRP